MLCDVCLGLVTKLVQLHRKRTAGSFPVRELIPGAPLQNDKGISKDCEICQSSSRRHKFKDMVVHFAEYTRSGDKHLEFQFDDDTVTKFYIERGDCETHEIARRSRVASYTGSKDAIDLAAH